MLKEILNYSFNITNKQAVFFIFIMACFLNIITFIILQHNNFYSYLNEDVACIIDMSKSFETEYELINKLNNHNLSEAIKLLKTYWKPPAFFVFSAPILLVINNINAFLSILNLLLCFIILLSVYGIVKNIYSTKAGLFASFILSFCPLFFTIHRTFFIETILTASICFVLYIITKNKFNNICWTILFTLSLTFALLTKEQIFIFYPVFLLFIVVNKKNYTDIKNFFSILIAFLCSYIFAYILWYNNTNNIFSHLLYYAKQDFNNDYLYYIKSLYFFDMSPFISVLFIISTIYFIFKKKHLYIFLSFWFILFIFSLSGNKVSRHIFPIIIFPPILISLFIFQIRNIIIRRLLIFIICFILLLQFITINFFNFKFFISGDFYNYNFFKGVTYYKYKSKINTYKQQYEYLKILLGNNFEENTAFIQFFPPQAYNFLLLQKNRNNKTCTIFTYSEIIEKKINITNYKNIVISSQDEKKYNQVVNFLLENNFEFVSIIDIFNHTQAKTFLYKKRYN